MSTNNRSLSNLDHINVGAISDIECEIDPCDLVSVMFLLNEDPQVTLQNLTVYLRVSNDIGDGSCNLLQQWAARAQKRSTWKLELLEALATCQLYTVIRKLGFNTATAKSLSRKGSDTSIHYIHPLKKIFYNVCDNLDSENYKCFKKVIKLKIPDHETCELFFLELICRGFFSPVNTKSKFINTGDVEKLMNLVEKIPVFGKNQEIQNIYDKLIGIRDSIQVPFNVISTEKQPEAIPEKKYVHDFNDSFELFNQLSVEELKNDGAVMFKTSVFKW